MYYGYTGTILRVNLTHGEVTKEALDLKMAEEFVGGRGLASRLLCAEIDPEIEAMSPENPLIFGTGPLTGTGAPATARYVVVCKAPLTGTIACSNSGGFFGPEIKFAGYDALIIEGESPEPVYLWIQDDRVEIRSASLLWGKTPVETESTLQKLTHPASKIACIGPGGEKLSLMAGIVNDNYRLAARSGVGALMGKKKLKAIAIRGTGGVNLADPEQFWKASMDMHAKITGDPVSFGSFRAYGTASLVNLINEMGAYPTRNFQSDTFEDAVKTGGEAITEDILERNRACFACPISCTRVTEVKEGPYKGRGEGPEYESTWSLGALCGVSNLEAVAKANYLCGDYGIDTISTGATIACAMELFETGALSEKEIGFPLRFGDEAAMVRAVEMTGKREGFGDILADGSYRLAERYGHPEFFMGVKKLEMSAYSPRVFQGMALQYATSNRGACHVRGNTVAAELYGIPRYMPPEVLEQKEEMVRRPFQNSTAFVDSTGICLFTKFAITHREICALLAPATGIDFNFDRSIVQGDRIWNLERMFNLRAGFTAADDKLPARVSEPSPDGPRAGSRAILQNHIQTYYQLRGWDEEGRPTRSKLKELNLEDFWNVCSEHD
ncbi:MAG: aldehyde ferredoxin oxidoreductase family protein [Deltaproteobacteria bacterium]|jgi:aldehyde:ferredoxin oxidoreductase|nr:aldehyde ferredoxin oxidoreductase family protein [Deltaproteobacteria bacterium]